jgi:Periplasmic binding protein
MPSEAWHEYPCETRRGRRIVALAGAVALAGPALAQEPIRIGFHVPLTDLAAGEGKIRAARGRARIEQVNANDGVLGRPLELVTYDDQSPAEQAVPIANKLLVEGVKAVISGSYSAPTRTAAGVFQKEGIPYISAYAIHPDITRAGDHVFRTSFMGEVQRRAGAKLVGDIMDKKRVVLITLNNDFGQSHAQGFKQAAEQFGRPSPRAQSQRELGRLRARRGGRSGRVLSRFVTMPRATCHPAKRVYSRLNIHALRLRSGAFPMDGAGDRRG